MSKISIFKWKSMDFYLCTYMKSWLNNGNNGNYEMHKQVQNATNISLSSQNLNLFLSNGFDKIKRKLREKSKCLIQS